MTASAHPALGFLASLASVPRRFPLAFLASLIAAVATMVSSESSRSGCLWDERLAFCGVFAFPAAVAAALWTEVRGGMFAPTLAIVATLGVWIAFPGLPARESELASVLLLILAATALASSVSGLRADARVWWRMNLGTLNAIVLAVIFALAVLIGLQLALFSLRELFGWRSPQAASRVFIGCVFFVGPVALLASLPRADAATDSFNPWRLLSKYALVPLGLLTTLILAAYALKIAWMRNLPDGSVAWPVLALGAYGTTAMLIARPWAETESWVRWFARVYPPVFLAASTLLFLALATRIAEEGVTTSRYLGLVTGGWFALAALLFLLAPARAPVGVTLSLALLSTASAIGPFSAAGLSRTSQSSRLTALLASPWRGDAEREAEVASRLRYLAREFGRPAVEPFCGPLTVEPDTGWNIALAALERLGHPAGKERTAFRSWRATTPAEIAGTRFLFAPERGFVALGTTRDGMAISIGRRDNRLAACVGGDVVHAFPLTDPAVNAPPPTFEWDCDGRTFRVVVFSFTLHGDDVGDVEFVVLEK